MSGVAVIRYLIATSAPMISVVPSARIMAGILPVNMELPAVSITKVSSVPHLNIAMAPTAKLQVDRIQVTVMVKTTEYPLLESLLRLVYSACPNYRGTIQGFAVDSILPDEEGPDMDDNEFSFISRSRDFFVKYTI